MADPADERITNDFDPLAAETFTSAHALYADMRETCPVAHSQTWNDDPTSALRATIDRKAMDAPVLGDGIWAWRSAASKPRQVRRLTRCSA
jgi:hypothetical protein